MRKRKSKYKRPASLRSDGEWPPSVGMGGRHQSVSVAGIVGISKKEKGFRDAMICESFFQLVKSSPKSSSICRPILVSGDERLLEAVKEQTSIRKNVHIFNANDELVEYINTMISTVTTEFVEALRGKASKYFYSPDNKDCLFFKEDIFDKIMTKFADKLDIVPSNAIRKEKERWKVLPPTFNKKNRQRVFWKSFIIFSVNYYVYYSRPMLAPSLGASFGTFGRSDLFSGMSNIVEYPSKWTDLPSQEQLGIEMPYEATAKFVVDWSVSVSTNKVLSRPRIDKISYVNVEI